VGRAGARRRCGFDQQYNLQAMAGRGQVILAVTTHHSPSDLAALHPLLDAATASLAAAGIPGPIGAALFGTGYASDANFTTPTTADLHVAVTRESAQTSSTQPGRDPAAIASWQQMATKLASPQGQALYKQRKAIIEPVFAQLFARFGRTLLYRGDMVTTEIHLWAAVHNTLKAIRARTRSQDRSHQPAARPAPAPA
jgi:hypothetical protein